MLPDGSILIGQNWSELPKLKYQMQYFWQFSNNVPFLVPLTTTGLGLDFTLLDTIGIFLGGSLTMEGNVVVLTSMTGPEVISGFAASISY